MFDFGPDLQLGALLRTLVLVHHAAVTIAAVEEGAVVSTIVPVVIFSPLASRCRYTWAYSSSRPAGPHPSVKETDVSFERDRRFESVFLQRASLFLQSIPAAGVAAICS